MIIYSWKYAYNFKYLIHLYLGYSLRMLLVRSSMDILPVLISASSTSHLKLTIEDKSLILHTLHTVKYLRIRIPVVV